MPNVIPIGVRMLLENSIRFRGQTPVEIESSILPKKNLLGWDTQALGDIADGTREQVVATQK